MMKYLKKTFRWFGPNFGVTLAEIRQLGVDGIVAACQEVPTGDIWSEEAILKLKNNIESQGLEWSVVESVNVHKAIKYGHPDRDKYIENYIKTLDNLSRHGIDVVCYNFMQLIDWTRTNLDYRLPHGPSALLFDPIAAAAFDLYILERQDAKENYTEETVQKATAYFNSLSEESKSKLKNAILSGMPGSRSQISMSNFIRDHQEVLGIKKAVLQDNLAYFLRAVIPEAESMGVKMCIHPDDPPFSVFGVPRIVSTYDDLQFVLDSCPSVSNGLTFCSGSLGASADNDLLHIIKNFGSHIHFIHLRNVRRCADGSFYEDDHLNGSVPIGELMTALVSEQMRREKSGALAVDIPMRPDHGHVLLSDGDKRDEFYSGYSLIGRAIGLAQLSGLEKGVRLNLL